MAARHILAIDQGTTGNDGDGVRRGRAGFAAVAIRSSASTTRDPAGWSTTRRRSGRVSLRVVTRRRCARRRRSRARSRRSASRINARPPCCGIGRTRQARCIVPSSGRIAAPPTSASTLKSEGLEDTVRAKTGLVIDRVLLRHQAALAVRQREEACAHALEHLAFGTIDSWLIWKLTGGRAHVTDYTNASRTLLFDIHASALGRRAAARCSTFRPRCCREVCRRRAASSAPPTRRRFGAEVPIAGIAGDQQAALFGQACFQPGLVKNTYGTGCFVLMYTGDRAGRIAERASHYHGLRRRRQPGLRARRLGVHRRRGRAVAARRARPAEVGDGERAPGAQGRLDARCLPRPGLRRPRRAVLGLGGARRPGRPDARRHDARTSCAPRSNRSPIRRATSSTRWRPKPASRSPACASTAAPSANDFLMQFQADLLGATVDRPKVIETTALGAALLAGRGVGLWSSAAKLERVRRR